MKILVIAARFPYPTEKGDKLRLFNQLRELSELGHELTLCALSEEDINEKDYQKVSRLCKDVNIFRLSRIQVAVNLLLAPLRGLPFQVSYFYNKRTESKITKIANELQPDQIYCQLIRTAPLVARLKNFPKTIDLQDAMSVAAARWASQAGFLKKKALQIEAQQVRIYEKKVQAHMQHSTSTSY